MVRSVNPIKTAGYKHREHRSKKGRQRFKSSNQTKIYKTKKAELIDEERNTNELMECYFCGKKFIDEDTGIRIALNGVLKICCKECLAEKINKIEND